MRIPTKAQVEKYLSGISKSRARVAYFGPLNSYGAKSDNSDVKKLGYGVPYLIVYNAGKRQRKLILSTMRIGNGFGHDYRSDRVENLVMAYDTWNRLPYHCRVHDLGAFRKRDSSLVTLGDVDEFFLLRPMIEGVEYYKDLERVYATGKLEEYDTIRARALAEYLVRIHSKKNTRSEESELYVRKIRDTVGHGECVFGLDDSYPMKRVDYLKENELEELEKKCVRHRWKLKKNVSRLSQIHGDFHPWNVLFTDLKHPEKFRLLDRSRGEWGEPADDICGMSINYIFSSLRKYGNLSGEFKALFDEFLGSYLSGSNDQEILEAMPLFYTFRCLVIASPVWYPSISSEVRRKIFNFATNVLDAGRFDPNHVNNYFEASS
ncbi:MAG: aminoglycoside phosphotransferase family protein [Nitrososphaerota archaeon]|nr:aminoglycoside phosphotransferase family protein [Nitrososphaerota archaeon]MDG6923301.1 aminoglycoside phosphotransferase family protein [Nitrososphaerota archaeon]